MSYLEIIRKYQLQAPVNIVKLAKEFGLNVFKVKGWPTTISGKIVKDSKNGGISNYAIFVNEDHSKQRQRFTVAHELAHFILHKEKIGDGIQEDALYRSGLPHREEVEANNLAAEILMPWSLINKAMKEGSVTVEDLAKALNVSHSAMAVRLQVPC